MKMPLTEKTFLEFCRGAYFNPGCSGPSEFHDDLKRVKYVKRLLHKMLSAKSSKIMREQLIMNHMIILKNVFGDEAAARILFFEVDSRLHPHLKSFMVFLDFKIQDVPEVKYKNLRSDKKIDEKLSGQNRC